MTGWGPGCDAETMTFVKAAQVAARPQNVPGSKERARALTHENLKKKIEFCATQAQETHSLTPKIDM